MVMVTVLIGEHVQTKGRQGASVRQVQWQGPSWNGAASSSSKGKSACGFYGGCSVLGKYWVSPERLAAAALAGRGSFTMPFLSRPLISESESVVEHNAFIVKTKRYSSTVD